MRRFQTNPSYSDHNSSVMEKSFAAMLRSPSTRTGVTFVHFACASTLSESSVSPAADFTTSRIGERSTDAQPL